MCGGAILSEIIAPAANRSRRLTADLLWNTDFLNNPTNYFSKTQPPSDDIDDDFEADFQGFKDHEDQEDNHSKNTKKTLLLLSPPPKAWPLLLLLGKGRVSGKSWGYGNRVPRDKSHIRFFKCNKLSHYASECPKWEEEDEVNLLRDRHHYIEEMCYKIRG
ncbi:hypothetical protein SSX86_000032 [Deinandra increscens subsp. villosa]|uniref:CCHC-type domain-containing protein n=1 Tax=Deinandra increscens subsp. villosa TaxID=3103831 RepID=A0AAP0DTJ1_9ASTR